MYLRPWKGSPGMFCVAFWGVGLWKLWHQGQNLIESPHIPKEIPTPNHHDSIWCNDVCIFERNWVCEVTRCHRLYLKLDVLSRRFCYFLIGWNWLSHLVPHSSTTNSCFLAMAAQNICGPFAWFEDAEAAAGSLILHAYACMLGIFSCR